MKPLYQQMWKLAKPYYEKGRKGDIHHIMWMIKAAEVVCEKENIDESLLLPLVILHDTGYALAPKENAFKVRIRKAHMKESAHIAEKILKEIKYPQNKSKKIVYWVSVHDNWALNDNEVYKKDHLLAVFTDLDYIWSAAPEGFEIVRKIMDKDQNEMIKWLETNDKPILRPFATATTKKIYEEYIIDRKKEIKNKK